MQTVYSFPPKINVTEHAFKNTVLLDTMLHCRADDHKFYWCYAGIAKKDGNVGDTKQSIIVDMQIQAEYAFRASGNQ